MVINMKKKCGWILLTVVLCMVIISGCGAKESDSQTGDKKEAETEKSVEDTVPAGDVEADSAGQLRFEAQDMDGNTVSESVFSEAKLTMVNVWATYCNPCLREMPELGELADAWDASEFQLIGIISDVLEGAEQNKLDLAASLIEQTGADYVHLLLNEPLYNALLTDVMAVPTTFFVNEKGEILDTVVGAMEKSAWEEKINALLDEM